jgi:hypothetical protein
VTLSAAVEAANDLLLAGAGEMRLFTATAPSMTLVEQSALELRAANLLGDLNQEAGTLSPDRSLDPGFPNPQGELVVGGSWTQSGGDLLIEIDGTSGSLDFDRVTVQDTATLGGTLTVVTIPGLWQYTAGDRYPIVTADSLSGAFTAENLPSIGPELELQVEINTTDDTVYLNVVSTTTGITGDATAPPAAPIALRALPNPARGPVAISYSVERPGRVRVDLYDVMGRRAATVLEGEQEAGVHELEWSPRLGRQLASGVYMLLVRSPGKEEKTSVTILR